MLRNEIKTGHLFRYKANKKVVFLSLDCDTEVVIHNENEQSIRKSGHQENGSEFLEVELLKGIFEVIPSVRRFSDSEFVRLQGGGFVIIRAWNPDENTYKVEFGTGFTSWYPDHRLTPVAKA